MERAGVMIPLLLLMNDKHRKNFAAHKVSAGISCSV